MTEQVKEPRLLFNNKERVEILSLEELKRTNVAHLDLQRSRTTPVAHYELIDDLMHILTEAGQEPVLDHIYATNQGGSTAIRNIEEQYGVKNILESWMLKKVTGKIFLPKLINEDKECCIAFAYHDKGIDVAFGENVHDCSNMCIYGSNILHTWGGKKDVDYKRLLEIFTQWSTKLDKMHEEDMRIIQSMMRIQVTSEKMLWFIGKLHVLAIASNAGGKNVAPLNVTQVNELSRTILNKGEIQLFEENEVVSLWRFYNAITFVMKAGQSDITTLLTDVTEIGNMMIEEFSIEPTIDVVDLKEE